ncbi:gliding motility lipoprotein GldH [Pontibacter sp. Tf4]|uniref:gliding motility lipoprotein GldH n=1 Tax=Pontibacter sp. Tf4 TaxID=2761620 RepID=UPI0016288C89|nr:gliding motility lipoprotein GldH [Pontibacter sp. Tf4]MBB6611240.1 gliding motility lipoprotein GldH [Pontibacter sp. Tf4]
MHNNLVCWAAAFLLLLTSCDPARVYEQNTDIPESNWTIDNAPVFEFEITEPAQKYAIYVNVRYNLQYDFYNLYLQHQLTGPDGKVISEKLHEVLLMDAKTGKPLGKGSSDTFDLQQLILDDVTFPEAGKYKLKLTQYMRRDPLQHIEAVGIRVAKK